MSHNPIKLVYEVIDAVTGKSLVLKREISMVFSVVPTELPAKAEYKVVEAAFVAARFDVQMQLGLTERFLAEMHKQVEDLTESKRNGQ